MKAVKLRSNEAALKKDGPELEGGACCLDRASGLYTVGHFASVLGQEMARLDRGARPLSLVLLEWPSLPDPVWSALGRLIQASLRPIDLAARLDARRVAVIMPDADGGRGRRWLLDLLADLSRDDRLAGQPVRYGRAMARPWEGRRGSELLALAEAGLGAEDMGCPAPAEEAAWDGESVTAIATEERNLLFDGFKALEAAPKH